VKTHRFPTKPQQLPLNRNTASGFALIITITMMILLALLAVGLLSLSTIAMRSSGQGNAMAEARANARLALTLAIGQLQKAAGPDQRITAPANIVDPTSSSALTGVWESVKSDPLRFVSTDANKDILQTTEEADGEFVAWLSSDTAEGTKFTKPPAITSGNQRTRLLSFTQASDDVSVAVKTIGQEGGIGWLTMDEGIKARFDLPQVDPADETERLARLRAPERPATDIIPELDGFIADEQTAAKVANFSQGELITSKRADFGDRIKDITTVSEGLKTDVVNGGLKHDLTLAFESDTLPTELQNRHVYSNLVRDPVGEADPYFSTLGDHYRLYKTVKQDSPIASNVPSNYRPMTNDRTSPSDAPSLQVVDGQVLAPVVTRVNVAFSLVAREAHGHWINTVPTKSGDSRRTYMVYLVYTPVVTVYNPYTVPLEVDSMKVSFQYLPLAFQFYRNGQPQTNNPALLSQFHVSSQTKQDWADNFTATLTADNSSNAPIPVTLQPGEARVFGVNHKSGTKWGQMTNYLWQNDLDRSQTLNMSTAEGWNYNSGFIVDWLAPSAAGRAPDNANLGVFGVRGTDTIDVGFAPKTPVFNNRPIDHFSVEVTAKINSRQRDLGIFRYRYGSEKRLIEAMEAGAHPTLGPITYPVRREKPWRLNELYQPSVESLPIERWTGPKQFAIFTLASRTAKDSLFPSKPGKDASFVNQVLDMDITQTHPAQMPMELSFLPVNGQGTNTVGSIEVASAFDPRSFFFSGWTAQTGLLHFPTYEIPRYPIVNIADLRNANLASSGHLPNPSYTVGESRAHPMVPANTAFDKTTIRTDHAWLANNTLWDSYYFSGLRSETEITDFFAGKGSPINPRLLPHTGGMTMASAISQLTGEDGWKQSAAFLTEKGDFNVQSTSVEAWKSVLSSLRQKDIPTYEPAPDSGGGAVTMKPRQSPSDGTPFPRLLDGPAGAVEDGSSANNQDRWAGFRELTEKDITTLAEEIVEGIKALGPFLSMSEFVNRKLDGPEDGSALYGVIEEAIQNARLNDDSSPADSRLIRDVEASQFEYAFKNAALGDTQEGATSFLSQGDILAAIGSSITVRSDTFVIRAYGEHREASGRVLASATCEAVIQRTTDYVDPTDPPEASPTGMEGIAIQSEINKRFGRQFKVVAFRWLPSEAV